MTDISSKMQFIPVISRDTSVMLSGKLQDWGCNIAFYSFFPLIYPIFPGIMGNVHTRFLHAGAMARSLWRVVCAALMQAAMIILAGGDLLCS